MFDDVRQAISGLASEQRPGASPAARSQRLVQLLALRDQLEAEVLHCVGEWDAAESWKADGATSAATWLTHEARLARDDAVRLVRSARLARDHSQTGAALADGRVRPAHVDLMARAARDRQRAFESDEHELVHAAAATAPEPFRRMMQQWAAHADRRAADHDAHDAFLRRRIRTWRSFSTTIALEGRLDLEGGAIVKTALEALDRPDAADAPGGPRTKAQRLADALVEMARHSLSCEHSCGHRPNALDVIVDIDTMRGEAPKPAHGRCEIEGVGPVARSVMERLACDAQVGRVIMRGKSEILDLGRRARVVSRAQRRALSIRDRRCVWPGCDAPPEWCDAHHIVCWIDGGETEIEVLVLLCRRHHVECHEGGWQLTRAPDGTIEVRPPPYLAA